MNCSQSRMISRHYDLGDHGPRETNANALQAIRPAIAIAGCIEKGGIPMTPQVQVNRRPATTVHLNVVRVPSPPADPTLPSGQHGLKTLVAILVESRRKTERKAQEPPAREQ
jgi:hypothetical protein